MFDPKKQFVVSWRGTERLNCARDSSWGGGWERSGVEQIGLGFGVELRRLRFAERRTVQSVTRVYELRSPLLPRPEIACILYFFLSMHAISGLGRSGDRSSYMY